MEAQAEAVVVAVSMGHKKKKKKTKKKKLGGKGKGREGSSAWARSSGQQLYVMFAYVNVPLAPTSDPISLYVRANICF